MRVGRFRSRLWWLLFDDDQEIGLLFCKVAKDVIATLNLCNQR